MKKKFRNLALTLVCFCSTQVALADFDKPIAVSQLPQAAQQVLTKHFGGQRVSVAKYEALERSYDVVLANGTKVEFNKQGTWTGIDGGRSAVPAALVPSAITHYVKTHHAGARIVKIEKLRGYYEVDLSNDVDLTFNKKYKVVDIDH